MGLVVIQPRKPKWYVEHLVCLTTSPENKKRGIRQADDDARRCQELAAGLSEILTVARVRGAAVELPGIGAQGYRPAHAMGMAKGLIAATLAVRRIPAEWVDPHDAKHAATGKKNATKTEVQSAVLKALNWRGVQGYRGYLTPKDSWEHIADAAATVLAARGWIESPLRGLQGPGGK